MFEDLIENRYPYVDALDFFMGGYWLMPEAVHLFLGWIFLLIFCLAVLWRAPGTVAFKVSLLYFSLALYNNPAFGFAGVNINEYFGVLAVALAVLDSRVLAKRHDFSSPVVYSLGFLFLFLIPHVVLIGIANPELNPDGISWLIKLALNLKIFVLAINLWIVGQFTRKRISFDFLIRSVVLCGTVGVILYLVQVITILTGTIPFGTYIDAGFIGVPSFGSVSIERGHFGKMMAPLAPFFLYAFLVFKWRLAFTLFVIVSSINISASSLSFFLVFCLLSAWTFRKNFITKQNIFIVLPLACIFLGFSASYYEVYLGAATKIYELAIAGDVEAVGGRTADVLSVYITSYPYGLGYSGSTYRTAPGLPEINSGLYAFFSQFSFFAFPIILGYGFLFYKTLRRGYSSMHIPYAAKCFKIGVALSLFIFFADILWFIPTIWLSYELLWSFPTSRKCSELNLRESQP